MRSDAVTSDAPPLLEVRRLHAGHAGVLALHDVSLSVGAGELVALVGPNGAGKTTLLRTISGLHRPASGEIEYDGRRIDREPPERVVAAGLAHVPQGRRIFGGLSVADNLELGAYAVTDRAAVPGRLAAIWSRFPVLRERADQPGGTLSGGEQQLLAIGRALVSAPRLLMLDEPSMGLSPLMAGRVFEVLTELREAGTAVLLVEQDARAALGLADRGYVLEAGRVVRQGSGAELLADPAVAPAYLGG